MENYLNCPSCGYRLTNTHVRVEGQPPWEDYVWFECRNCGRRESYLDYYDN